VGDVVALADFVRWQRRRTVRRLHAECLTLLAASVDVARTELTAAPARERWVRVARLRKLEDLHQYARMIG